MCSVRFLVVSKLIYIKSFGRRAARQDCRGCRSGANFGFDSVISQCRRRVRSVALCRRRRRVDFRYAPVATDGAWRCNMSRRATSGLMHCSDLNAGAAPHHQVDQSGDVSDSSVSLGQYKRDHGCNQHGSDGPHRGLERFRNSQNFWTSPIRSHGVLPIKSIPSRQLLGKSIVWGRKLRFVS